MCLERVFCTELHVIGFDSSQAYESHLFLTGHPVALWKALVLYLGKDRIRYSTVHPLNMLRLCSGSLAFLREQCSLHPQETSLLIVDAHCRSRKVPADSPSVIWRKISHIRVGGPTHFASFVGYQNMAISCAPNVTTLRRNVGDFVDYGMESYASDPLPDFLSADEKLYPDNMGQPVRYKSCRSRTGFIFRSLNTEELGLIYGLPSWLRQGDLSVDAFVSLVPIQLLDACLKPVLLSAPRAEDQVIATSRRVIAKRPTSVWLPRISRFLPNTWIDQSFVTDKAAKADDAGVPTSLWDQRVLLLWPDAKPFMDAQRKWLMGIMVRRLMREFRAFMATTHGPRWARRLQRVRFFYKTEINRHYGGLKKGMKGFTAGRFQEGRADRMQFAPKLDPFGFPKHADPSYVPSLTIQSLRELWADADAGQRAIASFAASDWWTWHGGSTLIFWRWPEGEQRKAARDGMAAYIKGNMPNYQRSARPPKAAEHALVFSKILKALRRGYICLTPGNAGILSLTESFAVPKGLDIRMVYNGSGCGLNDALWAPNFWLPSSRSATRLLDFEYHSVDLDLGEMFPNFPLPQVLRMYSGIDLTPFEDLIRAEAPDLLEGHDRAGNNRLLGRWERNWMGTKPSPYMSIRFFYWAEELARGDRHEPTNALRWDKVRLNLPGSEDYDPTLPRVMKWIEDLNRLANDLITFVDDLRASGFCSEEAWRVARQVAARLQYLGIQDAPRKRRPSVVNPGAWAGGIYATGKSKVTKTVSQEKWDKAKGYVLEILEVMIKDMEKSEFSYKFLERVRGFLVHLAMTFDHIKPYLKGLHLTLASHLPNRDQEGWKRSDRDWMSYVSHELESGHMSPEEADAALHPPAFEDIKIPDKINPVPRLLEDFKVLWELFKADSPPEVLVRCNKLFYILYGFADASGSGFGSSIRLKEGISVRIGTWGTDDDGSSNWREFENAVEAVEAEAELGNLEDALVYLATDNSTVEACAVNGTSSSPKLHALVVRLRKVEMSTGCKILIFHVSGERMKAQGTDGFSRGNLKEGVAAGHSMLSFIPLHKTATERSNTIEDWIKSWMGPDSAMTLTPEDWFEKGHDIHGGQVDERGFWRPTIRSGYYLWAPPPAAAEAAIEELRKARLKRQDSLHVFAVPRLLTPEWNRLLHKACDLILEIPPGHPHWPVDMYEPLILGICFPFLRSDPWQLKGTPKVLAVGRKLRRVFKDKEVDGGDLLRKLLLECGRLRTMPKDVVRKVLYFESGRELSCEAPGVRPEGRKRGRDRGRQSAPGDGVARTTSVNRRLSKSQKR